MAAQAPRIGGFADWCVRAGSCRFVRVRTGSRVHGFGGSNHIQTIGPNEKLILTKRWPRTMSCLCEICHLYLFAMSCNSDFPAYIVEGGYIRQWRRRGDPQSASTN
jgi:hypothetical protein